MGFVLHGLLGISRQTGLVVGVVLGVAVSGGVTFLRIREERRLRRYAESPKLTVDADWLDPGNFWFHKPSVRALIRATGRIEDRLKTEGAERRRLQSVLDGFADGVLILNPEDEVVYVNAAGRRFLDLPEDAVGRSLWELTRDDQIAQAVSELKKGEETVHREIHRVEPGHESFWLLQAFRLSGEIVVVLRDVTRLRRLQTVRQDFVANVSHELKTPLAAIQGLVETLREDSGMDPDTRRRFLNRVQSQVEGMANLVEDLLTLSRLEGGEAIDEERLDVRGPVNDALEAVRSRAREKDLELSVDLAENPLEMSANWTALRQLIGNLLDNAVKYTPEGGTVRVMVTEETDTLRFEVSDTGIGIEPRDQERIFERFYRVDDARTRDDEEETSTGLGLAIVKHVVQSLDGRLELESTPGQGSRFTVILPRQRTEATST